MTSTAPATTDTLVVAEVFGPTIQGEGPSAGRRAGFIRLGGCNLSCTWCDTPYTWDGQHFDLRAELHRATVDDIAETALTGSPGLVVISGGEPLLYQHQPAWTELLDLLAFDAGVDVEIETNGTIAPTAQTQARGVRFNVSPKLAHAGDPAERRIRPEALAALVASGRAIFKFVCATEADVDDAATLAAAHGIPAATVWVSPEGTATADVLSRTGELADTTVRHGFNLGTRLHVLAWGNERGR